MDHTSIFENINWLATLVATLGAFMLGALWHSKLLFSDSWVKEHALTPDHATGANMGLIFGLTFLQFFVGALIFEILIQNHFPEIGIFHGILLGLFIGLGWIGTAFGVSYLYLRKSLKIWMIDAGYYVVGYMIMGLVLAAWK